MKVHSSLLVRSSTISKSMHSSFANSTAHRLQALRSSIRPSCAMTVSQKNRAVLVDKPDKSKTVEGYATRIAETEIPSATGNKVLVKLALRPVNPSDVASVKGIYPGFNRARSYPATPGLEGVGLIQEIGESATKFKKGQRIIATDWGAPEGSGTWQQYRVVPEENLFLVPESVSDEAAAQALVNPVTAYGFLDTLKIPSGKWFIQSAANSELGLMMVSLCKTRGIKTINIVRREEAAQAIKDAGGDEVIVDDGSADLAKRVKEVTGGEMAYGATDAVTGDMTGKLAASLRPEGSVLVYGSLGGIASNNISIRDTLFRGVTVTGFWLSRYMQKLGQEERRGVVESVLQLLADGTLKPRTGEKFPLERVEEALAASEEPGKKGKVFLEG